MKQGGGKQKGSAFERLICKELSSWLTEGKRNDLFWRSAMSGGRATLTLNKDSVSNQAGDLSPIDRLGQAFTDIFYIECKFYKDLHINSLLFGTPAKNSLLDFWTVAAEEAKKYDKIPLVICKQNRREILVLTDHAGFITPSLEMLDDTYDDADAIYVVNNVYVYLSKFSTFKKARFVSNA